ncbi:hypothetical protein M514_26359 [Trichuris suis]|uniref:RNA-directed DNA polymerase n=1 Tax=Trichuris suis TaxID=68888 RepID=A0A085MW67_9BILA|nr:hypothetical protein M514_26359 [Trichuris suis]
MLALVWAVRHFRPSVFFKEPEGQVARWLELLSNYDFEVEHRPGSKRGNADALSQKPDAQYTSRQTDIMVVNHLVKLRSWLPNVHSQEMLQAQRRYPDIGPVLEWIQNGSWPEQSPPGASRALRYLWCQHGQFSLRDGLLYRRRTPAAPPGSQGARRRLRNSIVASIGLTDVANWCDSCEACARRKPGESKRPRAPLQPHCVGNPWERICLDFLGPFTETTGGNRYLLVVSDSFTKWTQAFPVKDMEGATTASVLVREWFCRYGLPEEILTDQGRTFVSDLMKSVCTLLDIRRLRTSAYQAQRNGQVERFHRPLLTMLSQMEATADDQVAVQVSAIRVNLPSFVPEDIDTWILMCENLLLDSGVTRQETMFRRVVAKLPPLQFRLIKHLITQRPLPSDCFDQLRKCLWERLALNPAERLRMLESLPSCLGDRRPTELYLELESLYPDDMDHEIIRESFLRRMPATLSILCRGWLKELSLKDVALKADTHWQPAAELAAAVLGESSAQARAADEPCHDPPGDASVNAKKEASVRKTTTSPWWDILHRPLVPSASPIRPRRPHLSGKLQLLRRLAGKQRGQPIVAAAVGCHHTCPLLFVRDATGRRYLVDSGSEVSILPPSRRTARVPPAAGPRLRAANGTRIIVFEANRLAKIDLGLGRPYRFKFLVADVPTAILGADFLREYGLIPDLKAGCLRDGVTFLSTACSRSQTRASRALVHLTVEHDGLSPPVDGERFRDFRNSQVFRALADPPGQFPAVTMPAVEHTIETRGRPVYARPRRLMPDRLAAAKKELEELIRRGILVPSRSPWSSPIHLVPKDKGRTYRMVGCYERLNAITVPDRYPIPDIQTFSDQLDGSVVFSKIDLARAYAQIKMNARDQPKTAITTPFGLYEYTRMPFGLRNAAQTFQRLMDAVLRGLPRVFSYIDDILVFSRSDSEHRADLNAVLDRLRRYGLTIRPEKCVLGQDKIEFLGFELSKDGLRPLPDKVHDLLSFAPPRTPAECRRFVGMINYYHRFLPNLALVLQPLYDLTNQPKHKYIWRLQHDAAFQKAKQLLASATALAFPRAAAPTQVIADASDSAVGAVIQQLHGNRWVPIAFHSKKLTGTQRRWSTGDKELFALVSAVRRFRYLLEGRSNLQLCTDHKPLVHAFTSTTERSARVQRQLAFLSEYSTDIRHISGSDNAVSDCLSRPPDAAVNAVGYDTDSLDLKELAEEQQRSPEVAEPATNQSLQIENRSVSGTSAHLLVDVSTGCPRPLVPDSWKRDIFDRLQNLHHPGTRATKRLLSERFVWKGMSADVTRWCKTCLRCQSSKIGRHLRTQLLRPPTPSNRFEALHVDIVGPLECSRGYQYIFAITDRYTRYPDAIPMAEATAAACARALLEWISRFGVCFRITSDRELHHVGL